METCLNGEPKLVVNLEKLRPVGGFGHAFPMWQKRCFVIGPASLSYYKSADAYLSGGDESGFVDLKDAWALFVARKDKPPEMTLRTPWRDYRLRAASQEVQSSPFSPFPQWSTPHGPEAPVLALARLSVHTCHPTPAPDHFQGNPCINPPQTKMAQRGDYGQLCGGVWKEQNLARTLSGVAWRPRQHRSRSIQGAARLAEGSEAAET